MKIDALLAALVTDKVTEVKVPVGLLEKARAKLVEEKTERLLQCVTTHLSSLDRSKSQLLAQFQRYKKQMEHTLKRLKAITLAGQYAEKTGNFLPVVFLTSGYTGVVDICRQLDVESVELNSPLLKVPTDWRPE